LGGQRPKPELAGESSVTEVRNLLREWKQSSPKDQTPAKQDLDQITNFLLELVTANLEEAQTLVQHLLRYPFATHVVSFFMQSIS
jgi:hypothetical protein